LTPATQDDGFREIQLNGKQLVFLFMAATVVSVVIFLCGVLVGRGVRGEPGAVDDAAVAGPTVDLVSSPADQASPPAVPAELDPTAAAPPAPADDDLTYFDRLERRGQPVETLKAPPAPAAEPSASSRAPVSNVSRTAADSASEPRASGYAVQVAALNVRREADAIARRLSEKGYDAYVISPANGTPSVYRVRVGTFRTRRDADTMAARLQKEEHFKPWVTR
jgi:cell division septation protein DedD